MSQQFARIPTDAGAVVREVRGFGGVPWGRLFGYLRPHWRPFSIALVGLVVSSAVGLAFPLIIAGITTEVVAGGDAAGLDGLIVASCRAVPHAGNRWLPADVPAGRGGGAGGGPDLGRALRTAHHPVARLPCQPPRRRADLAPVERRDARAHDAHPDRHEPAVLGHRARGLGRDPVHAEPDAPARRPAARAGVDRRGDRLRSTPPTGQHAGPGHDRPQHDDRGGSAVGDPRREELRPRGLGARALRQGPPDSRRDWIAPRAVAGRIRRAAGLPRLRRHRGAALVHRPPGDRWDARHRDADRVPALRRRHRGEPGVPRQPVRAVPGGDRGHRARVRDHRHPTDDPRRARSQAAGARRRPDRARRGLVRVSAGSTGRARRLADGPGRGDPRLGRAVRLRQDDARRA